MSKYVFDIEYTEQPGFIPKHASLTAVDANEAYEKLQEALNEPVASFIVLEVNEIVDKS